MIKKISQIIAIVMFIFGAIFIAYSLIFPEQTFPWGDNITYIIYGIYIILMIGLLIFSLIKERKGE